MSGVCSIAEWPQWRGPERDGKSMVSIQKEKLIEPILNKTSDFTKENRFRNIDVLISMPKIRLIGNIFLSFINFIFCFNMFFKII